MTSTTVDLDVLKQMVESWRARGEAHALQVAKLQKRLKDAPGGSFTADEVKAALAPVAQFYELVGREKALSELIDDLSKTAPAPKAPQAPGPGPWRLP